MKIPFNLERCIAGDEVIAGDGADYVFGAYNKNMIHPLIGWIHDFPVFHSALGIDPKNYGYNGHHYNLFMKPKKITRWIYVEPSLCFMTKDDALSSADRWCPKNNALIKIEYYKGENID